MKDIIILNHDPLIERIKDGFCIDYLIKQGINVKYLDLSNFYFPKLSAPYQSKEEYVIKLNSEKQILNYLKSVNIKNTIFISEALPNWKSRRIYRFLSDHKAVVVKISIYATSSIVKRSLLQKLKLIKSKDLLYFLLFKLYKYINKVKIWDYILTSNYEDDYDVRINHPDYETYLKTKDVEITDKYIVFLDEYFPDHPELVHWFGKDLHKLSIPYRRSLTNLFDYLEKTFEKEIIICAHPKSMYKGDEFGHHRIVKGETAKYVRNSLFILMHVSSSSSFAILNNKPLVILSSKEYQNNIKSTITFQREFSKIMGIDINDINKWRPQIKDIKPLSPKNRENFIYNFLTSKENQNKNNGDIILSFIQNVS